MSLPMTMEYLRHVETDPVEALAAMELSFKHMDESSRREHASAILDQCARRLWVDGVEHMLAHWPAGLPVPTSLASTIIHATSCPETPDARMRGELLATSLLIDLEWERQRLAPDDLMALVVGGPHGFLQLPTVFDKVQAHLVSMEPGLALDTLDLAARTPSTVHSGVRQASFRHLTRLRQGVLDRSFAAARPPLELPAEPVGA